MAQPFKNQLTLTGHPILKAQDLHTPHTLLKRAIEREKSPNLANTGEEDLQKKFQVYLEVMFETIIISCHQGKGFRV
jgi:hypothetical protein